MLYNNDSLRCFPFIWRRAVLVFRPLFSHSSAFPFPFSQSEQKRIFYAIQTQQLHAYERKIQQEQQQQEKQGIAAYKSRITTPNTRTSKQAIALSNSFLKFLFLRFENVKCSSSSATSPRPIDIKLHVYYKLLANAAERSFC